MDDVSKALSALVRERGDQLIALFPLAPTIATAIVAADVKPLAELRSGLLKRAGKGVQELADGGWPLLWPESHWHTVAALRLAALDDKQLLRAVGAVPSRADAESARSRLDRVLAALGTADDLASRLRELDVKIVESEFWGGERSRILTLRDGPALVAVTHRGERLHGIAAVAGTQEWTPENPERLAEAAKALADDESLYVHADAEVAHARQRLLDALTATGDHRWRPIGRRAPKDVAAVPLLREFPPHWIPPSEWQMVAAYQADSLRWRANHPIGDGRWLVLLVRQGDRVFAVTDGDLACVVPAGRDEAIAVPVESPDDRALVWPGRAVGDRDRPRSRAVSAVIALGLALVALGASTTRGTAAPPAPGFHTVTVDRWQEPGAECPNSSPDAGTVWTRRVERRVGPDLRGTVEWGQGVVWTPNGVRPDGLHPAHRAPYEWVWGPRIAVSELSSDPTSLRLQLAARAPAGDDVNAFVANAGVELLAYAASAPRTRRALIAMLAGLPGAHTQHRADRAATTVIVPLDPWRLTVTTAGTDLLRWAKRAANPCRRQEWHWLVGARSAGHRSSRSSSPVCATCMP